LKFKVKGEVSRHPPHEVKFVFRRKHLTDYSLIACNALKTVGVVLFWRIWVHLNVRTSEEPIELIDVGATLHDG
jgi:hypothetical protein